MEMRVRTMPAACLIAWVVAAALPAPLCAQELAVPGDATNSAADIAAPAESPAVEAPTEETAPPRPVRASGFLDQRWTGGYASVAHLFAAKDTPHLQNLTEASVQLKLDWGAVGQAYADVSFVYQRGWLYWAQGADGTRERQADHDVPALRPLAVIAELYAILNIGERLNATVGKKRVLWGPGLAWNPADLLNPPKDPTDPTLQRAGPWLARLELPLDNWTFTLAAAAKTTQQFAGVPTGLWVYPDNAVAKADDAGHYAIAARVYRLIAETDVNFMAFWTNLYNDPFQDKLRLATSASHVFGNALEVHVEVLGQQGSSRLYVDANCAVDLASAAACFGSGKSPVGNFRVHDTDIRVKALAGLRYQFGENAAISAEYLYNAEGANQAEFGALVQGMALAKQATSLGAQVPFSFGPGAANDAGTPQKFAFEPLRRHYLFLTYLHPQLNDDFTINAVVLLGLEDLSGQFVPQITWSAREWVNLTLGAFYAIPGLAGQGAQVGAAQWTEASLQPNIWRTFLSARLFF